MPSAASRSATARPMPPDPPVTIATRCSVPFCMVVLLLVHGRTVHYSAEEYDPSIYFRGSDGGGAGAAGSRAPTCPAGAGRCARRRGGTAVRRRSARGDLREGGRPRRGEQDHAVQVVALA